MGCLKRSFAAAVGVDESSLTAANERSSEESADEVKIKAADLDRLTEQMSEKLTTGTTTSEEKFQILTLTPDSWTTEKAALYFDVSEYQVQQARDMRKSRGILSKPDNKRGKPLSKSTAAKVQLFFEDDAHSRLMPGKKDFVSIRRNVHKQKRLLL